MKFQSLSINVLMLLSILSSCSGTKKTTTIDISTWEKAHEAKKYRMTGVILDGKESQLNKKWNALRDSIQDSYLSKGTYPLRSYFYTYQNEMGKNELYTLLEKMPKGSLHHVHTGALTSIDWVIEQVLTEPKCHMYTSKEGEKVYGALRFFEGEAEKGYEPISKLKSEIPALSDSLKKWLSFGMHTAEESVPIWREFENRFNRINGFTNYAPMHLKYYTEGFRRLAEDGVMEVEMRAWLAGGLYEGSKTFTSEDLVEDYLKAEKNVQEIYPNFKVKLIYAGYRGFELDMISTSLEHAFELRKKYPNTVVGFDLVGEEDAGHTTKYHRKAWEKRAELEKKHKIDMPFFFHDGESNHPENENLIEAMYWNTKRIGHGFNLIHFPSLMEHAKKNEVCIEICPLSNQILKYVADHRNHPAFNYWRNGIPISISPDDPGVFGYEGVTPDFWMAVVSWELDLLDLKTLVFSSIRHSSMNDTEKKEALSTLKAAWDQWILELEKQL